MGKDGASAKVVILTALISAVASIVVAFIGIVPIWYQKKTPVPSANFSITGKIVSHEKKPLKNADVYLIAATGSEFMATTDDYGQFAFEKIPTMSYWIVVRDNESGKSSRVLIQKEHATGEINVMEALLTYQAGERSEQ